MARLAAEGVEKEFWMGAQRLRVLRGITHTFADGKLTTVEGASGSGKSTLLHVLGGIEKPDAGRVLLDGVPFYSEPARAQAAARNRRIGFVFQAYHLLPEMTALENVMLPARIGRREGRAKAAALLEAVGLGARAEHLPAELSGGEQQRVAIARALVNEPEVLLADEPTGNLDSKTGGAVLEMLLGLRAGRGLTAVLVTHDAAVAARGDFHLHLADGALV